MVFQISTLDIASNNPEIICEITYTLCLMRWSRILNANIRKCNLQAVSPAIKFFSGGFFFGLTRNRHIGWGRGSGKEIGMCFYVTSTICPVSPVWKKRYFWMAYFYLRVDKNRDTETQTKAGLFFAASYFFRYRFRLLSRQLNVIYFCSIT